jgi:hypothetical protein
MGAMAAGVGIFAAAAGAFSLAVTKYIQFALARRDRIRGLGIDPDTAMGRRLGEERNAIASIARTQLSRAAADRVANALAIQYAQTGLFPQELAAIRQRQLQALPRRFRGAAAEQMNLPAEFAALADDTNFGLPVIGTGQFRGSRLFENLSREGFENVMRFWNEALDREEDP